MFKNIVLSGLILCTTPAFGIVLEFNDAQFPMWLHGEPQGITITESGYTMSGWYWDKPGTIHLHDDTGYYPSSTQITGHKPFDAKGFKVDYGLTPTFYLLDDETSTWFDIDFPNILVQGIRNNSIVAEKRFTANHGEIFELASDFRNLDSLVFSARGHSDPGLASYFSAFEEELQILYPGVAYEIHCAEPCSWFSLDSVEVTPTPLPGALVMMLSAILGGGVARRFVTRKSIV